MKKLMILSFVAAMSVAGCSKKKADTTPTTPDNKATTTETTPADPCAGKTANPCAGNPCAGKTADPCAGKK